MKNIVLVHGAWADGSGWQEVHSRLRTRGHDVSIVQAPLTSLADDVAAVKRVLARQDGPTLLVGHIKPLEKLTYTLKGTCDGQELTLKSAELKVPAPDADHYFLASIINQWQNAKDQPALIRADRALALSYEANRVVHNEMLGSAQLAMQQNNLEAEAAISGQAPVSSGSSLPSHSRLVAPLRPA